jgi:hypothetical protein
MSEIPTSIVNEPLDYCSPDLAKLRRPKGLTLLGRIETIVGFVVLLSELVRMLPSSAPVHPQSPISDYSDRLNFYHLMWGRALSILFSVLSLLGGILLLKFKPLGRTFLMSRAISALVISPLFTSFNLLVMTPHYVSLANSNPHKYHLHFHAITHEVIAISGLVLALSFAIFEIHILSLPNTKAALEPEGGHEVAGIMPPI